MDVMDNMEIYSDKSSPFSDSEFAKYCFEHFDTGGPEGVPDGMLTYDEIIEVTSIDCSGLGIRSLAGMEVFVKLDTLICRGNEISSLPLDGTPMLKYLDCSGNYITELNVSQTMIRTLFCNPMSGPDGKNLLEYLFIRRGQEIEYVTKYRDKADPKRIPDETEIISVPEVKDESL